MRKSFWTGVTIFALSFSVLMPAHVTAQTPGAAVATLPRRIEPPSPNATAVELERRGDELRAEKAYLDALDYYQASLKKLTQGSASILNKIGITQFQMQRFKDAKKSYEKAIKTDKEFSNAYNNLGVIHYAQKKYGRAAKYYRKAITLDPNTASFHSNLAAAYFADKKMEKAIPEYLKALSLDPEIFERRSISGVVAQILPEDRARYSYIMAKTYAQVGQFDRALLYLRRAIEEGYDKVDDALKDAEFAELRKDPRFNELMTVQRPTALQ